MCALATVSIGAKARFLCSAGRDGGREVGVRGARLLANSGVLHFTFSFFFVFDTCSVPKVLSLRVCVRRRR